MIAAVTVQIIRDWVVRFNAEGPVGLVNRKAPGKAPKLNARQREELCRLVERGPIPSVDGVVRWRLKDLAWWVYQEYRISIDESTLGRMFKAMGYAKLSARPYHHARNERLTEDFIGNANYCGFLYARHAAQCILDLLGTDPLTAGFDHVVPPSHEIEVAILVLTKGVTGV